MGKVVGVLLLSVEEEGDVEEEADAKDAEEAEEGEEDETEAEDEVEEAEAEAEEEGSCLPNLGLNDVGLLNTPRELQTHTQARTHICIHTNIQRLCKTE